MFERLKHWMFADPAGSLALIRRLLTEHGGNHWRSYALSLVMMAVVAACTAGSAYLLGSAINEAYVHRSFYGVAAVSAASAVLFSLKGIASYGQTVLMAQISNRIVAENQRRMFDMLLRQSLSYFSDRHSSEFTSRVTYGASSASNVLNMLITTFGRDALTLVSLVTVMVSQAPILSIIGLAVMPPAIFMVRHLIKRVRAIAMTGFTGGTQILETLQETIQGLRVVKALNLEDEMRRRVYDSVESVERSSNKMARVSNRSTPLMETMGGLAIALVLLYGGYRVLVMNAPPGEFVSFITAFLLAYEPAKRIARLNVDLNNALLGVQILFDLLDLPQQMDDSNKPALTVPRGRIVFDNVTFAYREDAPVLRGMSFVAEPGQVTALVGPSGGGKSTIFNLLLRFYEVERGIVSIDGTDIASTTRQSLRDHIAYVGQDIFLFRGTIRENIAFGRLGASQDEIIAAARAAHAHDFIMQAPMGYDTPVGEHGLQLSGGQRQRIAVARALIRNAPIILLDEPTASLDTESEVHVQDAIARLSEGRTNLVIAHRLHTITHANMIYVVEHGVIAEGGRHEALLRSNKRYANFYRLQFERRHTAGEPASLPAIEAVPGE